MYTMRKQKHKSYTKCPVEATLDIIGGKWKGIVLYHLTEGMLTLQLRQLENDGLLKRKIYKQIPPKVEYFLTDLGQSLTPILHLLKEWGMNNILPR